MKLKQAITENHVIDGKQANPSAIFMASAQSLHLKHGSDYLENHMGVLALEVAQHTRCYASVTPECIKFWSMQLSTNLPECLQD